MSRRSIVRFASLASFLGFAICSAPAIADPDTDGDGFFDAEDNCSAVYQENQRDTNLDGYGNACDPDYDDNEVVNAIDLGMFKQVYLKGSGSPGWDPDFDANGDDVVNAIDLGVFKAYYLKAPGPSGLDCAGDFPCPEGGDQDGDGVLDEDDNCAYVPNGENQYPDNQYDANEDGYGNACDGDFDDDRKVGDSDRAIFMCSFLSSANLETDLNVDGITNALDNGIFMKMMGRVPGPSGPGPAHPLPEVLPYDDADSDGVQNYLDNCLNASNDDQTNSDYDLFGNACDADYTNDGVVDGYDAAAFASFFLTEVDQEDDPGAAMDSNGDGFINALDLGVLIDQFGGPPGPSGLACAPAAPIPSEPLTAFGDYFGVIRGRSYRGSVIAVGVGGTPATYEIVSEPSAGELVLDDPETGAFTYTSDPEANATDDSFTFTGTNSLGTSNEATVKVSIWDPTGSTFTATEQASKALIVYNTNYPPAQSIAEHYRASRSIDSSQVCAVEMPNGLYATSGQLASLRKQVVEGWICEIIQDPPEPCVAGDPEIAEKSPLTHLVLIKGLPARLFDTGWSDDYNEPSLDYYLSYWLYRSEDIFDCPSHCPGPPVTGALAFVQSEYHNPQAADFPHYYRALEPARELFLAYGRVEAMTPERTEALIDRTLEAEAAGFTGNMFGETAGQGDLLFGAMRRATASFADECTEYVTHATSTWPPPPAECRAGTTYADNPEWVSGQVPGEQNAKISVALKTGLFLGAQPFAQDQNGFDGVQTLPKWHRTDLQCNELCAGAADPEACAESSTDYFRVLDTECVGAAPGLIGVQLRSHPVGYYGFFPAGWDAGGGDGQNESTVPQLLTGGAFTNATFTDEGYLHLGVHSAADPDDTLCVQTSGGDAPCRERIALLLQQHFDLDPAIPQDGRSFRVRVRHRNQANPSAAILRIELDFQSGSVDRYVLPGQISLTEARSDWHPDEVVVQIADEGEPISRITLSLRIFLADRVEGFLDLDGIELIDEETSASLLSTSLGSFASDVPDRTHLGDWAANAIDRLGAVGWWGASSHHWSGFYALDRMLRGFLAGRTYGESVTSAGYGHAALIYGDPLYRPSAAALFLPSETQQRASVGSAPGQPIGAPALTYSTPGLVVTPDNLENVRFLMMSVLHGSDHLDDVNWSLSTCPELDPAQCGEEEWTVKRTGEGSVKERPCDWTALIDPEVDQEVTVRLKVWNCGDEANALYDFASFDYRASASPGETGSCGAEVTQDFCE